MSRINTNVSSFVAQQRLAKSNNELNTALARLSTGLRINTGKDDPAGLIASEILRADITGVEKAITNTDRASQMIQTADSALGQMSNLLNDIRGLIVEAANEGALSSEQIAANQLQVDSSLEAIDRIARTTSFGGKKLLDGSLDMLTSSVNANIVDLDIEQANLGTTGTKTADIVVTDAATQASNTDSTVAATAFTFGNSGNEMSYNLVINSTANVESSSDNINIIFAQSATVSNETEASFDTVNKELTITFDTGNNANNQAIDVQDAIRGLTDANGVNIFDQTNTTVTGGTSIGAANDAAIEALTKGGVAIGSTRTMVNEINRVHDRVIQLTGASGSETFTFGTGTTQQAMADAINGVADSIGITAAVSSGNLVLTSSEFGTKGIIDIKVLSEGTSGSYKTNNEGRSAGTDAVATIDGTTANSEGNKLSINTKTLDVTATVASGTTGTMSFTIDGGGANFQLGKDVVTGEQARIGIGSFSSGALGNATDGFLYSIRSGETRALATDSIAAQKVVDDVISYVAKARGRLGAFSSTTLESNKIALGDYLANLTEAESSLRDADFAKESAALTRAQILVQSGTSVLAIANQNPQNVLALLG